MSRVSWLQTFSGHAIEPFDPDPKAIRFEDIAHGLALTNRFAGQSKVPYTVAQHCVVGSWYIDPRFALPFLMHELGEVYLGDVITQVKGELRTVKDPFIGPQKWVALEARHERAILEGLGLANDGIARASPPIHFPEGFVDTMHGPEVKAMDEAMLAWEARDLMGPPPAPWGLTADPPNGAANCRLTAWTWHTAEFAWAARFWELTHRVPRRTLLGTV